ncbi:glycosyltransferase family 2 protein [candidate division KSB1 bacterium]|nr:glycosyltransferase family 2 protein [candidate division KSB1 bacterium]
MYISIVVPLYNEESSLKELVERIKLVLIQLGQEYEIVFIDDGSTDRSAAVIEEMCRSDSHIKFLQLRKNYGKAAALAAGFEAVEGLFVVTMDADLQDDPKEIIPLVEKLQKGYDLVSGWKKIRHDPLSRRLASKVYNFFTSMFSGIYLHDFNCGLKAYRQNVVKTIKIYGELHRYLPVLAHRSGFRVTEMVVTHHPRKHGKSKYGFARYLRGAFDLMTVTFLTKYQKRPLHLFGGLGLTFFVTGFIISAFLSFQKIFYRVNLSNRPLLFLGVLLIIVGIQFFSIGLLGEMYTASRPHNETYIIKKRIGWKD